MTEQTTCLCRCHAYGPRSHVTCDQGPEIPGGRSCVTLHSDGDDQTCEHCGQPDGHTWVEGDCVLPHRAHSRKLLDCALICVPCVDRFKARLGEITTLYATLGDVILAGSVPVDESEWQKPRKAPASPSPLRLDAWAMFTGQLNSHVRRDDGTMEQAYLGSNLPDVPAVMSGWAQAVFDANGWTKEAPVTVSGAVAALIADVEVLAKLPDVDTFDADLRWVYRSLRSAHGLGTKGAQPVGKCPSLDGHGRECGGPLWPDKSGVMAVDCGRCARHFGEAFLRHLGGMIA